MLMEWTFLIDPSLRLFSRALHCLLWKLKIAKNLLVYAVFPGQTGSGCSMYLGHILSIHGLR